MGSICGCELDMSRATLSELKKRVEGDRRRVHSAPKVFVTIEELILKDGGSITFSPLKFSLQGLEFNTLVEIQGTKRELAALVAGKVVAKVQAKLDESETVKKARAVQGRVAESEAFNTAKDGVQVAAGKAQETAQVAVGKGREALGKASESEAAQRAREGLTGAADKAKGAADRLGLNQAAGKLQTKLGSSPESPPDDAAIDPADEEVEVTRQLQIAVTVDLIKELGVEEVSVAVKDVRTEMSMVEKVLSIEKTRTLIETAISKKASEVASRMAKKEYDKKVDKVAAAVGQGVAT